MTLLRAIVVFLTVLSTGVARKPNIVVIVSDNQGWMDIGYHGSEIRTPTLDRLAEEGIRLNRFYVYPMCSPTRAAFISGRAPSRYGILGAIGMRSRQVLPPGTVTVADTLKAAGYETAITGKWHLGLRPDIGPRNYGFDHSYGFLHGQIDKYTHHYKNGDASWHRNDKLIDEEGHSVDLITAEAVRFIERKRERPFFLYVPFGAPHPPLQEEARWVKPYEGVIESESRRLYAASVTHMDSAIGEIVDALDRTKQRKNTLLVYFSDNGAIPNWRKQPQHYGGKFPEYPVLGSNGDLRGWIGDLYDGCVRTPAFMNWPGVLKPGILDEVTSALDLHPTLAAVTQGKTEPEMELEGRNIWFGLQGSTPLEPTTLYWKYYNGKKTAVLAGDWKLHHDHRTGEFELFDLRADPNESLNLADGFPSQVKRLRLLLDEHEARDREALASHIDLSRQSHTSEELKKILKPIPPKPIDEFMKTFEVAEGYELQLVAHEPMVVDPIAGCFDADGRLYVCEMRDYPYRPAPGEDPLSRIRLLEDLDGDGVFDKSTVFADKLLWVSGVAPWKGGVYASAAPDIWYLKDTDGDGVADIRKKIFTGFGDKKSQSILNNLKWSIDNRIYGATSGNGGNVAPADQPNATPITLRRKDFRFDPHTHKLEAVSGRSQFGNTFDIWGNRYVCSQAVGLQQVMLPEEVLRRYPLKPVPNEMQVLAPLPTPIYRISPIEPWRAIRSSRRIASGERKASATGANHHVLDGAAGSTIYHGGALDLELTVFIGGAQNNVVHRRVIRPSHHGPTTTERVDHETEFIRSSDNWFRPVNFIHAPDGNLLCLDFARETLEAVHIPYDVAAAMDLTSGRDRGRVYRIVRKGYRRKRPLKLERLNSKRLVELLDRGSLWQAETARRLLYERQDRSVVPLLRTKLDPDYRHGLGATGLWLLHGLGRLANEDLLQALKFYNRPPTTHRRMHAMRLSVDRMSDPRVVDAVLTNRIAPLYRAIALGNTTDPRAVDALARIAASGDRWVQAAALSSCDPERAGQVIKELLSNAYFVRNGDRKLLQQFATLAARVEDRRSLTMLIDLIVGLPSSAHGLKQGLLPILHPRMSADPHLSEPARKMVRRLISDALIVLNDPSRSEALVLRSINLLRTQPYDVAGKALENLIGDTGRSDALRQQAIRGLSGHSSLEAADALIKAWPNSTPKLRQEILNALTRRLSWTKRLVDLIQNGVIKPTELGLVHRQKLTGHDDQAIARRASRLLRRPPPADRETALKNHQAAIKLQGDAKRGEAVFGRACAACHQLNNTGNPIGPNLAFLRNRSASELLIQILDPNRDVDPAYLQYTVELEDGSEVSGMIVSESAAELEIQRVDAKQTIKRTDIKSISGSSLSLMPEGLEQGITPEQMADLLAYLRSSQYDRGTESDGMSPVAPR